MNLIEFKNLPDTSTPLNADNLNNNFNELKNSITNLPIAVYDGGSIDPNETTEELILTAHANNPLSGNNFMYIRTMFYSTKTSTSHRTQIAYPYNSRSGDLYERHYTNGVWSAWASIGNQKSVIMVHLNSNTSINNASAWANYTIPFNKIKYKFGDKFTLNSDGSVTYTGSSNLKITMQIQRAKSLNTAGNLYPTSSVDNYFQTFTSDYTDFATYVGIASGSQTIKGIVKPATAGTIGLYGDSVSTYTYMLIEEL